MFNQVKEYVSKMRELGYSEDKIRMELQQAGWSEVIINNALTGQNLPIVPTPGVKPTTTVNKASEEEVHNSLIIGLLYVLNFITLWIAVISFIFAVFSLIDKIFVSSLEATYYPSTYTNTILNGYIAALVVSAPIYVYLFILLKKKITDNPEFRFFKSRKILIVLTLVAGFLTIVIDLISVLTSFLNGDVSLGSFLKFLTIMLVLIPIFMYYYHELSEDKKHIK